MSLSTNVGTAGGDLAARRFAIVVTLGLTILALPSLEVSDRVFRLVAIMVTMNGTLLLMAGLVFVQKTHYAGIMLIPSSSAMLLLAQAGNRPASISIGLVALGIMAFNLVTRRCRLNRLLGVQSCA